MQTHLSLTNHCTHLHTFHWQITAHAHIFHWQTTHTHTQFSWANYCTHTHLSLTNHCTHTHFKLKTNLLQPIRWWCGQELQDWCRDLHCCHCTPATKSWIITTSVTVTRSSCTHTHARMYTCTHTHACMHMHACTYTHTDTHICMHTHTHTHTYAHTPHSSSDRLELFMGPCPINSRA